MINKLDRESEYRGANRHGGLLVVFRPHGFGPLRLMKEAVIDCLGDKLADEDVPIMPEPVCFGGTVVRDIAGSDVTGPVQAPGSAAHAFAEPRNAATSPSTWPTPASRIVVVGAGDNTLSTFAAELLERLAAC